MKKIFYLFFVISFSFQSTFAQKDRTASAGPIPKMKLERNRTQVNPIENQLWQIAYGHSSIQNYTLSMPIPAGTPFTLLSSWTPPVFASSMVHQPWTAYYYITEIGPPPALYKMNSETGVVTLIGNITGLTGSDQPNGISYNSTNDHYYIISSTNLFLFDPLTLNATLIGPFNTGGLMIDLCFDWGGVCYAYDLTTDCAYTINISTGNATFLGPLGYDANFGQGMSYDFETNTIYLSAFNSSTFTGQLRTMNPQTGMTTLVTDWGFEQIAPFSLPVFPCMSPVGQPTNLSPPYGATNIPISGVTLEWINGVYTVNVEVWFGPVSNAIKVYDGPAITSWTSDSLLYNTNYKWYIIDKDTICGGAHGNTWIFTTENPPGLIFTETFNDLLCWTWIGPFGQPNWGNPETSNAGGTSPELQCSWQPEYVGLNQIISCPINTIAGHDHEFRFKYMYKWWADPAPEHGIAITYDGGATSTVLWNQIPVGGNTGPEEIIINCTPTANNFQIIIYNEGNSFNFDFLYYDDIQVVDLDVVPVALTSFTAGVRNDFVELEWSTSTETNNSGFDVERARIRSSNYTEAGWERIGFIEGKGTTTETQNYSFTDKPEPGKYKYRLKQIDFDGTFAYSPEVEAEVKAPNVFSLEQNYPNPFNPSTKIKYTIPASSLNPFSKGEGTFVTLKLYDILGNEVATLVNEEQAPGVYEVEFNPESSIKHPASGIYFYQLSAGSFIETKKMILLK